jgi:hypothetical protein
VGAQLFAHIHRVEHMHSLKRLASDVEAKQTVEGRLRLRIENIITAIKSCSALCDSYQNQNAAR